MNAQSRIYVGTYAKYNSGSIKGAWLDLEDYTDKDGFLEACQALHSDEAVPELMFQDWEGIPAGMVTECHIDEALWDWLELDQDDRDMVAAYHDGIDQTEQDVESIRDRFQGCHDSRLAWAEDYIESTGMLEGLPVVARNYFDYESFARDAFMGDVSGCRHGGQLYVFSNC
jgi:antirestriction protein